MGCSPKYNGYEDCKRRDAQRHNRLYHKRRKEAIRLLGGRCVDCGTTRRLEFDHVDQSKKRFAVSTRVSDLAFWSEVKKCVLRCKKHHKQRSIRQIQGERAPAAKLSTAQVLEIRQRIQNGEVQADLAREYGVGPMQISRIKHRRRWKHV